MFIDNGWIINCEFEFGDHANKNSCEFLLAQKVKLEKTQGDIEFE